MSENSDAEKKHDPTQRRLQKAREDGSIRRSNDLPKAALTVGFILLVVSGGSLVSGMVSRWMAAMLTAAGDMDFHSISGLCTQFALALCVIMLAAGLLAFGVSLGSGGWMMSLLLLLPKLERVDPTKSWGHVFSLANLIEVGKSALKILVIGGGGWIAYTNQRFNLLALASPRNVTLSMLGGPAFWVILGAASGAVVLAAWDVVIQAWLNRRSLRMTDQEMKDEVRNADGDPHVRSRRRALMQKAARARQIQAVKTATMVVTNPTHFAVAVRYRRSKDVVPIVLAKGADINAEAIIAEAREHGIPLVEAPPLARALHRHVAIDQAIPSHLYRAVAEVLAYVWRLEAWRANGGAAPIRPAFPDTLDTPPPTSDA